MRKADQFVQSDHEYRKCLSAGKMETEKILLARDHPGLSWAFIHIESISHHWLRNLKLTVSFSLSPNVIEDRNHWNYSILEAKVINVLVRIMQTNNQLNKFDLLYFLFELIYSSIPPS